MFRLPLGDYFDYLVHWLQDHGETVFDGIKDSGMWVIEHLEDILLFLPWWLLVIIFIALRNNFV